MAIDEAITYVAIESVGHALFADVIKRDIHHTVDLVVLLSLHLALHAGGLPCGTDDVYTRTPKKISISLHPALGTHYVLAAMKS